MAQSIRHLITALLISVFAAAPLHAQETGEAVRVQGNVTEDVYAAGGTVDVQAKAAGDVVVAGGRVAVSDSVGGDLMAAGGSVDVSAHVADDARVVGGDVTLNGTVGDDALIAGGNVTLAPNTTVGGRGWFAGGRIDMAGTVGKELKASGGRIVISGTVHGDVELVGDSISILDGAVIDGNLNYRSSKKAQIADGAQIGGGIHFERIERPEMHIAAVAAGVGIVVLLSLFVTGVVLYLMFSRFVRTALTTLRSEFWKCLGIGLALFAATPLVISALFMTVIGGLPALVVGALYLLLLLAGFLMGIFYVGQLSFGLSRRSDVSHTKRLLAFAAALVVVTLLGLVPLLGSLLLLVLLLLGMGALMVEMYRAYVY